MSIFCLKKKNLKLEKKKSHSKVSTFTFFCLFFLYSGLKSNHYTWKKNNSSEWINGGYKSNSLKTNSILFVHDTFLGASQDKDKLSWVYETVSAFVESMCYFVATDHKHWGGVRLLVNWSNGCETMHLNLTNQEARKEVLRLYLSDPSLAVEAFWILRGQKNGFDSSIRK